MAGESGSVSARGWRRVLAVVVSLGIVVATRLLWPEGASPPAPLVPGEEESPRRSESAPARDVPEEDRQRVEQQERLPAVRGPFLRPPRHPTWRAITGTTRRKETGWPVNCWFTPLDEEGQALQVERRSVVAGAFHVLIPPGATTLKVSARKALDLQDVRLDLPVKSGLSGVSVLLPPATALLRGQVVDRTGGGLEGVRIELNGRYAHRTSGPNGSFHFGPLRDNGERPSYWVSVAREAFAVAAPRGVSIRIENGIQLEPALLIIDRGASVRGVVRSQSTGEPLGQVRILLSHEEHPGKHRTGRSDDRGSFEFQRLAAGSYQVTANSDDGLHGRTQLPVANLKPGEIRGLTLELRPGAGSLSGRLADPDGTPVPFASVVAIRESEGQMTTRSDTRGQFRFRSLAPGTWTIGLEQGYRESNNWIAGENTRVEIRAGEQATVELRVEKGAFLEGQVVSEGKRPGLRVRMRLPSGEVLEEATGAEGRFAFGGLGSGTYFLEVIDPGLPVGSELARQTVFISGEQSKQVLFRVP